MKNLVKKIFITSLSVAMSSTLTFAEHTRAALSTQNFEQDLSLIDQASPLINNRCDIASNPQVQLIDSALEDNALMALSAADFKIKLLEGLQRTQRTQERMAKRVLDPNGLLAGRREARSQRRLARFNDRLSRASSQNLSPEDTREILISYMDKKAQATQVVHLSNYMNDNQAPREFLEKVRSDVITMVMEDCHMQTLKLNGHKGISRSIAHAGMPASVGRGLGQFIGAVMAGVSAIAGIVVTPMAVAGSLVLGVTTGLTLGIGLIVVGAILLIIVVTRIVKSR